MVGACVLYGSHLQNAEEQLKWEGYLCLLVDLKCFSFNLLTILEIFVMNLKKNNVCCYLLGLLGEHTRT